MKLITRSLRMAACALLLLVPAHSTVIATYSDLVSLQTASSALQLIDFEGIGATTYNNAAGLTLKGVQFIGTQGTGFGLQIFDTSISPFFDFGTKSALAITRNVNGPAPTFHIVLPAAITAFGFNIMTASPNGLSVAITVAGNTYTPPTFGRPTPAFFGATLDAPVTTIDIMPIGTQPDGSTYVFLDNFSFGTATTQITPPPPDVPEVATLLMIGTGLIAFTGLKRRRRLRYNLSEA